MANQLDKPQPHHATIHNLLIEWVTQCASTLGKALLSLIIPIGLLVFLFLGSMMDWMTEFNVAVIVFLLLSYVLLAVWILFQVSKKYIPVHINVCTPPYCGEKFEINGQLYAFYPQLDSIEYEITNDRQTKIIKERLVSTFMSLIHLVVGTIGVYLLMLNGGVSEFKSLEEFIQVFPWFVSDLFWGVLSGITPYTYETLQDGTGLEFISSWLALGPILFCYGIAIWNMHHSLLMALFEDPNVWE